MLSLPHVYGCRMEWEISEPTWMQFLMIQAIGASLDMAGGFVASYSILDLPGKVARGRVWLRLHVNAL